MGNRVTSVNKVAREQLNKQDGHRITLMRDLQRVNKFLLSTEVGVGKFNEGGL